MSPWNISGAGSDVLRIILVIGIREGTLGPSMISQMDSLAKCDDLCNDVREVLISCCIIIFVFNLCKVKNEYDNVTLPAYIHDALVTVLPTRKKMKKKDGSLLLHLIKKQLNC